MPPGDDRDVAHEQLVNITRLTPRGLAEASAEALKLDAHARTTRPAVFAPGAAATRAR